MIASSKEADSPTRQEANINDTKKNNTASSSADASPTSWFRLKDPRIVRVSRAFGGKDRHSKVCTVRGLRDRRVRLSVQTAIQLYDLQDRLGLNQPSKVVDWLLNAAKHEIDELPPLPIPPGCFSFNHQMMLASQASSAGALQPNRLDGEATAGSSRSNFLNSTDAFWRDKCSKDMSREPNNHERDFTRSKKHEEERQGGESTEGWVNNSVPFGSLSYQLEPQNFAFPTILTGHGFASNTTEGNNLHLDNFNFVQLPSTLSLSSSSGTHQIFVPSHQEIDPRAISHLQMLSSATQTTGNAISAGSLHSIPPIFSAHQSLRPFQLSMTSSRPLHAQGNTTQTQPEKGLD